MPPATRGPAWKSGRLHGAALIASTDEFPQSPANSTIRPCLIGLCIRMRQLSRAVGNLQPSAERRAFCKIPTIFITATNGDAEAGCKA